MSWTPKPCIDCGRPKPKGRGRQYCEPCAAERRRCIVCGDLAVGDRRTCSDECLAEFQFANGHRLRAAESRKPPKPLAAERPTRTCPRCERTLPQNLDHFTSMKRDPVTGKILRYHAWCRDCHRAYEKERWANRTPEQIEADQKTAREAYEHRRAHDPDFLEKQRRNRREWRRRNPDKEAAMQKAWAERLRADTERHEAHLENRRIYARSRQLDRGVSPDELAARRLATAKRAWRQAKDVALAAAFVPHIEQAIKATTIDQFSKRVKVPERTLRRYLSGESRFIEFEVADRIALVLGLPLDDVAGEFKSIQAWLDEDDEETAA